MRSRLRCGAPAWGKVIAGPWSWCWTPKAGTESGSSVWSAVPRQHRSTSIDRGAESRRSYRIGREPRLWIDDRCLVVGPCRSKLHRGSGDLPVRKGLTWLLDMQCGQDSYRPRYARIPRRNGWNRENARQSGEWTNCM